jgi:hypothetical protein
MISEYLRSQRRPGVNKYHSQFRFGLACSHVSLAAIYCRWHLVIVASSPAMPDDLSNMINTIGSTPELDAWPEATPRNISLPDLPLGLMRKAAPEVCRPETRPPSFGPPPKSPPVHLPAFPGTVVDLALLHAAVPPPVPEVMAASLSSTPELLPHACAVAGDTTALRQRPPLKAPPRTKPGYAIPGPILEKKPPPTPEYPPYIRPPSANMVHASNTNLGFLGSGWEDYHVLVDGTVTTVVTNPMVPPLVPHAVNMDDASNTNELLLGFRGSGWADPMVSPAVPPPVPSTYAPTPTPTLCKCGVDCTKKLAEWDANMAGAFH